MAAIRSGQDSPEFRESFGSLSYILLHFNIITAVLSIGYYFIFGLGKRRTLIYVIGFVALVSTFFMAARTQLFAVVVLAFFFRWYLKPIFV
jgi:hypothetical protein